MPIDPSVISGLRPIQIPQQDPIEQYGKSLALKGLLGQQDLHELQLKQATQGVQDDEAVRSAYQQAGGDSKVLRSLLTGGGQYKAIQALDKFDLEQREKRSTIDKNETESAIKKAEHAASILSVAKDDPSAYPVVRRLLQVQYPQLHARLPEQFDAGIINGEIASGMSYVQKLTAEQKAKEMAETGRHNTVTEGAAAAAAAEARRHNKFTEDNPGLQHIETPDGVVAFNPRSGETKPVLGPDGKPLQGKSTSLTESQGNATGFGLRAQKASDAILALENNGTFGKAAAMKQGLGSVPLIGGALEAGANLMLPAAQQQYEQAQRDFINAVLRKESGANINESEFSNARKQYFPQPGDSNLVLEQKRKNRATAIESLKIQAGPGAKNIPEPTVTGTPLTGNETAGQIKFLGFE